MDHSNLTFVEQRLHLNGHDLNKNDKFSIIERIEEDIKIRSVIEQDNKTSLNKIYPSQTFV